MMTDGDSLERGERTPLLGRSAAAQTTPDLTTMQAAAESESSSSIKEKAVTGFAGVGFLTSLLSMIFESTTQHPSVLISGCLGMILSPYAAFQQRKLSEVEALQQTNELLGAEVTHLQGENIKLTQQVQQVEESVCKLAALEATMEAVNALQGDSVDKLEQQLQESKEILSHMDRNIQAVILQNLVTVLLATDANQDMMLSDEEIDELIQNLEGIQGVQLKEDLLRKTIVEQGRSVGAVMEVARNVLTPPDKISSWESMFSYLE